MIGFPARGFTPRLKVVSVEAPAAREAGIMVDDIDALLEKLKNEAKVL